RKVKDMFTSNFFPYHHVNESLLSYRLHLSFVHMKTRTINFKIMHKKTPIRLIDWSFSSLSLLCNWIDAYFLAIPTEALKLDHSVDFSKQRIVSTTANIFTRIYFRTALAEENRSTGYKLTVPSFGTKSF